MGNGRLPSITKPWKQSSTTIIESRLFASTAVQRCARKSVEFASGSKIVDKNRGGIYTRRGFC